MGKATSTDNGQQSIEVLEKRYHALNTRKIQAESDLKHAKKQLETLCKDAVAKYGTDDLDQLRAKLAAMKTDNEEKRKTYQAELELIENNLATVESSFTAMEAASLGEEKR
jgi:tRNA A37 threonylcarbamoyladenosine dehydratase